MRAAAPKAISKRPIHRAFTRKMETYGQDERYRCEPLSQEMHRSVVQPVRPSESIKGVRHDQDDQDPDRSRDCRDHCRRGRGRPAAPRGARPTRCRPHHHPPPTPPPPQQPPPQPPPPPKQTQTRPPPHLIPHTR